MSFHAHFVFFCIISGCFQKWRDTSSLNYYSSTIPVDTAFSTRGSVCTNSSSQVKQVILNVWVCSWSLSIQYSITAQHSSWIHGDISRLVAAEDVRNNFQILELFSFPNSHTAKNSVILNRNLKVCFNYSQSNFLPSQGDFAILQ